MCEGFLGPKLWELWAQGAYLESYLVMILLLWLHRWSVKFPIVPLESSLPVCATHPGGWVLLTPNRQAMGGPLYWLVGVAWRVRKWVSGMSRTILQLVLEELSLLPTQVVCYCGCIEVRMGPDVASAAIARFMAAPSLHVCGSNRHNWCGPTHCFGCLPPPSAAAWELRQANVGCHWMCDSQENPVVVTSIIDTSLYTINFAFLWSSWKTRSHPIFTKLYSPSSFFLNQ